MAKLVDINPSLVKSVALLRHADGLDKGEVGDGPEMRVRASKRNSRRSNDTSDVDSASGCNGSGRSRSGHCCADGCSDGNGHLDVSRSTHCVGDRWSVVTGCNARQSCLVSTK